MNFKLKCFHIGLLLTTGVYAANAQSNDNKTYSILHPVPKNKMREMETDRPDVTESPYTVDAGHIQYETDLLRVEHEKSASTEDRRVFVNNGNLKIGLFEKTALQVSLETFIWQKEKAEDGIMRSKGRGDVTIRIKQNLLGVDKGSFALAILPYLRLPTAKYTDDSKYEGGVIIPMSYKLPGEWKLGTQLEADRENDQETNTMHTDLIQSLTISHEVLKNLDGIAETYYRYDFNAHHWTNFLNASAQYKVSRDFMIDAGMNYGIQKDAIRSYFMGTAFRF